MPRSGRVYDLGWRQIIGWSDARRAGTLYGARVASLLARRWVDAVVVVLAVAAQVEVWTDPQPTSRAVAAPAALLWTLPLLLRGRLPLAAPAVVFVVLGLESFLPGHVVTDGQINVFALVAAFCVSGTHENPRRALAGGAIGYAALAAIVLNDVPPAESAVLIFVMSAAAWAIGRAFAERGRRTRELEQQARHLEQAHEAAALSERARIASELHDVVAHSVSVMTIQAGAARLLLDDDPEKARDPLIAVEETGHQALAEMRRLLGVLRGSDDTTLTPQPGLAQLDALVEQTRAAGLPVDVSSDGDPRPLPPGIDLTAFRVIQEALTNVLKHGGAARAQVTVRYHSDALEIDVTNSGRVAQNGTGGYGLLGMRQRVALYGGELDAKPRAEGGFEVHARLPTTADNA